MTKRQDPDAVYGKRQFDTEVIVLCVRLYVTYRLSYPDLIGIMAERGRDHFSHDDHAMGDSVPFGIKLSRARRL